MPRKRTTGRPALVVRLHPEAHRRLKERAEEIRPGLRGGVSAYVRELIYRDLEFDSGEWEAVQP